MDLSLGSVVGSAIVLVVVILWAWMLLRTFRRRV